MLSKIGIQMLWSNDKFEPRKTLPKVAWAGFEPRPKCRAYRTL